MTGVRIVAGLALLACACTQDFNKFLGDASSPGDGGGDAASEAATCNVPQTCLSNASACGQACISGYNTCTSNCGPSQACRAQCKNQETTCDGKCVTDCVTCSGAGTCAQTSCQGALP